MNFASSTIGTAVTTPTVLIVDDDPANLHVLGELLQPLYRVRVANSGAAALRIAASTPMPDLILLDVMMPGMDGYEVLGELKETPATSHIPVIFLTALGNEEDERHGLDLGAVDFLTKPIRPSIVLARVRNHLELKHARDILDDRNQALTARIKRIFDYSRDILCVLGFDGYFKEINPAATTILGWREAELHGRPWLDFVHPEDRERAFAAHSALAEGSPLHDIEVRFQHCLGHYCWLSWNAFPVREEGASFCVIRDVTVQKVAEAQMEAFSENLAWQVEHQLNENRAKDMLLIQQSRLATLGDLLHNVAHHWRQPLNALAVLLANIKDAYDFNELSAESLEREVEKGNRLVQRMSATIDDFRSLFNIDRSAAQTPFRLDVLARDIQKLLGVPIESQGIRIVLEHGETPTVFASRTEVTQILVNLLNNARDAIVARQPADKTIHITIGVEDGQARLDVRDHAGGMTTETLERIFDPYFTTREKSAGIGLYLSRMLAERQQGHIEVENCADGAQATIYLPLAGATR